MKQTKIIEYFNSNYDTNDSLIIKYLNRYIHSSHRHYSRKMDGYNASWQPSWPEYTVESYSVYYDSTMAYHHKSGRIVLNFVEGSTTEISLYKFKRFLRRKTQYDSCRSY